MIRSAYDGSRVPVAVEFSGPGKTKQSFKAEADINNIMAKYQKTGLLEAVNKIQPQYGDVVGLDFQTAMEQINLAQSMFDELPSTVRKRFRNDPADFVDFVSDPANADEAERLGLIKRPEPVEKPPVAASEAPVAPSTPALGPGSAAG